MRAALAPPLSLNRGERKDAPLHQRRRIDGSNREFRGAVLERLFEFRPANFQGPQERRDDVAPLEAVGKPRTILTNRSRPNDLSCSVSDRRSIVAIHQARSEAPIQLAMETALTYKPDRP